MYFYIESYIDYKKKKRVINKFNKISLLIN